MANHFLCTYVVYCAYDMDQRWPVSLFPDSDSSPVPKFLNPAPKIFKFDNPTPVQTPATIIDPTIIYPCFYLRYGHTDSCYCRNWKVAPGPVFHKFLTPCPKEKRRILPESTPALRCQAKFLTCEISDFMPCAHAQSNIVHIKYAEKTDY